jgi:hypothetical protein
MATESPAKSAIESMLAIFMFPLPSAVVSSSSSREATNIPTDIVAFYAFSAAIKRKTLRRIRRRPVRTPIEVRLTPQA